MTTASLVEMLLGDIRDIFDKRAGEQGRACGPDAVRESGRGFGRASRGGRGRRLGKNRDKPLTQNRLARLLKPLAIAPENIQIGDKVPKGYVLERFKEAFARYLG